MSNLKENQTVLRAQKRALIDRLQQDAARAHTQARKTGHRGRSFAGQGRQLQRLQAALGRIETGTYGICMQCGTQISPDRLRADPSTALCACCKGVG